MNAEIVQYVEQEQFDLVAEVTRKPDADPVKDYLATLRSAASVSTMEQALGVVVLLLAGAGRPDNVALQKRDDRRAKAQEMKKAAHDFEWFKFDGAQAKKLVAALAAENYAKSSQNKMIAATIGTLKQVEAITEQELLNMYERLDGVPMTEDDKLKSMDIVAKYFGRRALVTSSALRELKKFKPKAPTAPQPATSVKDLTEVQPAQPARKRRKGTIDRSTKGPSDHRQLSKRELNKLWAICAQNGAKGARDMVVIALGFGAGLRRAEIAALQFSDVDWAGKVSGKEAGNEDGEETRELPLDDAPETEGVGYLPITIQHGKGDKKRVVYASNGCREALLQWKEVRRDAPGPLLYSFDRWDGMQVGKPIDKQVVYTICDELATRAKVRKFSPHDMRRTFVSGFIENSKGDIAMAARLAGHASIQTTMRYDKRDDAKAAAASIKAVSVPYEPVTVQTKLEAEQR